MSLAARRSQILYRQGDEALWLVNTDGRQNRKLKLADGRVGVARWSPGGKSVLYLNLPDDKTQLHAIREHFPDQNQDKLLSKTSQFAHFGWNSNSSVFVGASANKASPHVLLLARAARTELALCEHKASDPYQVAPVFAPDSQRIYFQWKQPSQKPSAPLDTYVVGRDGSGPVKLSDEESKLAPPGARSCSGVSRAAVSRMREFAQALYS